MSGGVEEWRDEWMDGCASSGKEEVYDIASMVNRHWLDGQFARSGISGSVT